MHKIIDRFKAAHKLPYTAEDLSIKLHLPISIVTGIIHDLVDSQLLSKLELMDNSLTSSYQPAYNISLLNDETIAEALRNNGESYTRPENPS